MFGETLFQSPEVIAERKNAKPPLLDSRNPQGSSGHKEHGSESSSTEDREIGFILKNPEVFPELQFRTRVWVEDTMTWVEVEWWADNVPSRLRLAAAAICLQQFVLDRSSHKSLSRSHCPRSRSRTMTLVP